MKRILTAAVIMILASCEGYIKMENPQNVEFGDDLNPRIELIERDGKYTPATAQVPAYVFNANFPGTWKLTKIMTASYTGSLTDVPFSYADGNIYPFFAVKEEGKIRQYIETPSGRTYKDGSYSYDPNTGIIYFRDAIDKHPEFRVYRLEEDEMSGTFTDPSNNSDKSVLTLYVYKKLSILDAAGLDSLFGAE